ncbi:MAG: hypothetical protein WDO14_09195 [Bacteroidota bacterium]
MAKHILRETSILIDKITNSIEDSTSGKMFETDVLPVTKAELVSVLKKNGWQFNWKAEAKESNHQMFKLTLRDDSKIQGLLSIEVMDNYVEMYLIENAPHNFGKTKTFVGVAGNLVAFACKTSFDLGFDGYVSFTAKSQLVEHYKESLGAVSIYTKERMAIPSESARKLVNSYYKDYFNER